MPLIIDKGNWQLIIAIGLEIGRFIIQAKCTHTYKQ